MAAVMATTTAARDAGLVATLQDRFGHEDFRRGQHEAVAALAKENRDVAVFWATGGGKSLCFQLPALHGRVNGGNGFVVVVSPLISLMQDQVRALNATVRKEGEADIACFLGSAQRDPQVLARALAGQYALVYVSPEKLLSFGFLDELRNASVTAFAIDEAHCVCEWGADFRKEYAQLGKIRDTLPHVPLMALTATASPRVRADIMHKLKMRNALLCKGSFDRPNLEIFVKSRPPLAQAAKEIGAECKEAPGATIVYCATRKLVEELTSLLGRELGDGAVRMYHAGLSEPERTETHGLFITGQVPVVVATVAFGMGIDKPDVRRVVHYGPPKTMEAYVQQIGRAGRDGLPSRCLLYFTDQDFVNYSSDFYVGGLSAEQRKAVLESTGKLRDYAHALECRRYRLLKAFGEEDPAWGTSCGTCDICQLPTQKLEKRDYSEAARHLLSGVTAAGSAWTHIQKRLPRGTLSGWSLPKLRKLLDMLVSEGFVKAQNAQIETASGFKNSYVKYFLTPEGAAASQSRKPILLTPSIFFLDLEKEETAAQSKRIEEIMALGLNPRLIPPNEIKDGKGPVYDAFLHWARTLRRFETAGNLEQVQRLKGMKLAVEEWRKGEALRTGTAPSTVIPEHIVCKVAYARPTSTEALRTAGVRSANLSGLAKAIEDASDRLGFANKRAHPGEADGAANEEVLVLPTGRFSPPKAWRLPAPTDEKKAWFQTCLSLQEGDSLGNIALNGTNQPRQVATIAGHALTGLQHGLSLGRLDLGTLAKERGAHLTKSVWEDFDSFAVASNLQPCASDDLPSDWRTKYVRHFLGDEIMDTPFKDRTDEQKARCNEMYSNLDFWLTLKRIGFAPTFAPAHGTSKRARIGY